MKSTSEKKIIGTYRADRDTEHEVNTNVIESVPKPPKSLKTEGKTLWREVCEMLLQAKLLDRVGLHMIQIYCESYDQFNELSAIIQKEGLFIDDKRGSKKRNPALLLRNQVFNRMNVIGVQFGFTPIARSKIGVKYQSINKPKRRAKISLR